MISLKNSEVFKKDYARMQQEISELTNEDHKREVTVLLLNLLKEISSIDMHHDSITIAGKMPEGVRESREKMLSIRQQIDSKLKHYRRLQQKT